MSRGRKLADHVHIHVIYMFTFSALYGRYVNETLHDETETLMPRNETETFHNTSETETFKSRDRDVLVKYFEI